MEWELLIAILSWKTVAILLLILILIFIGLKEKNKDVIKKDKNGILFLILKFLKKEKKILEDTPKEKNVETKKDFPNEISKLFSNLDTLQERTTSNKDDDNPINASFFSKQFDKEFIQNNGSNNSTTILSDEILKEVGEIARKKLGNKVSSLISRIDEQGRIVLDMAAINFITGKNIPIVMTDGTIRVIDFLTLEEEVELAIKNSKPILAIDKENNIRRLTSIEIQNLTVNENDLAVTTINVENEKKLNSIKVENEDLLLKINDLEIELSKTNEYSKKLEYQLEIIKELNKDNSKIDDIEEYIKNNFENKLLSEELINSSNKKEINIPIVEQKITKESTQVIYDEKEEHNNQKEEFVNEMLEVYKIPVVSRNPKKRKIFIESEQTLFNEGLTTNENSDNGINEKTKENIGEKTNNIEVVITKEETKEKLVSRDNVDNRINERIKDDIQEKTNSNIEEVITKKETKEKLISNDNLKNIKIESLNSKSIDVVETKELDKKSIEKVCKDFFDTKNILNKDAIDTKNKKINDILYYSYNIIPFTKDFVLNFNESNLTKLLKKYLEDNGYKSTENEISLIYDSAKVIFKKNSFFTDKSLVMHYQTNIIQIQKKEEELYGINFGQNRFTELFSLEETKNKLEIEQRARQRNLYELRLKAIETNSFTKL